ncbi:acyl-CoA dehydrogenase family protein [Bordetella sp. N]|uniref:acyl-CoA dehydrogenase family protein n=1 Tax=Bordetella sp. N TaxID=1746199 RepID=UPI00070D8509|nr:acyl-CoA dehydrogenase family protein [Bordetella sp. N]ALM81643.1 monooxygenase [Bordetella sp. N]
MPPDSSTLSTYFDPFPPDSGDALLVRAVALRPLLQADAVQRDKAGGRPVAQIALLKQQKLNAAAIAPQYGGEGASWVSILRVVRELARSDGSLAHLYGYQHLPLHTVLARGTDEQQQRWFSQAATEQWLWSNSGNAMSKTSAAERVPGGWIVDGFRPFSSGSHVADVIHIAWQDSTGARWSALIPADRAGVVIEDDWDGIGQTQTGSGTVSFHGVRVRDDEVLGDAGSPLSPFESVVSLLQQSVLANVFIGSAVGALDEAREYTVTQSRPWIHSGVERHVDDPWIQRAYGDLAIRTLAAIELADDAAAHLDRACALGRGLDAETRGRVSIDLAAANVYAGENALDVTEKIFELMGARSATRARGYDRFWRNVRTHTLHNPAEYKKRTIGAWLLRHPYAPLGAYR